MFTVQKFKDSKSALSLVNVFKRFRSGIRGLESENIEHLNLELLN